MSFESVGFVLFCIKQTWWFRERERKRVEM